MYVTYGIVDPASKLFVYVGQTNNLERRREQHLSAHRLRKTPKKDEIRYWLRKTIKAGREPQFVVLDDYTQSEEESLASERLWVKRLAEIGHPLYNRWEEHKAIIEANLKPQGLPAFEPYIFVEKKSQKIGKCTPNRKKTGYRIILDEGVTLREQIIELLPPARGEGACGSK